MNASKRSTAQPGISSASAIDEGAGVIRNVVLCQAMQPKGSAGVLEIYRSRNTESRFSQDYMQVPVLTGQDFIESLYELSKSFPENGQKVRFGHPNMCTERLGKHCGFARNFQLEDDKITADIHLSQAAKQSPDGDLHTYVLKMAQESPDAIMMSIVFRAGQYYFIENGEKVEYDESEEHFHRIKALPEQDRVLYETVKAWYHTDFVDEGANTNNLFRSETGELMPAAAITEFLDENPEVFELAERNPHLIDDFLNRYKSYKQSKSKMEKPSIAQRVLKFILGKSSTRNIIATTTDDVTVNIITESDMPAVGDQVLLNGTEEPAPAGNHVLTGEYEGWSITTDENGVITESNAPAAVDADATEAAESPYDEEKMSRNIALALRPEFEKLTQRLSALEADMETIKTSPISQRRHAVRTQDLNAEGTRDLLPFEKELKAKLEKSAPKK